MSEIQEVADPIANRICLSRITKTAVMISARRLFELASNMAEFLWLSKTAAQFRSDHMPLYGQLDVTQDTRALMG